jgi:hypothetical protein
MLRAIALLLIFAAPGIACKCLMSLNACHEVETSSMVFAGTVESIEPNFLRDWNPAQEAGILKLNEEYARAKAEGTPAALARLKSAYRSTFPDTTEERKQKLETARTPDELGRLFYGILDGGMHVKLRVREQFKSAGDDDDDDDDKPAPESIEVWTPFGDCGFNFQIGETYLVYADNDEESGMLSTGSCSRTRRLTDAGDDLAYLFFRKEDEKRSTRLEGFVTGDSYFQAKIDKLHDPLTVLAPLANALVALDAGGATRHVRSGADGRFIFDGVGVGNYTIQAFRSERPGEKTPLSPARTGQAGENSCVFEMLLVK